jgi:hypothetical protein
MSDNCSATYRICRSAAFLAARMRSDVRQQAKPRLLHLPIIRRRQIRQLRDIETIFEEERERSHA